MTRRHLIAVLVGLAAMLITLVPPLWIRTTGDEVALELRPVDPLSLFRGNYVDLRYDVPIDVPLAVRDETVYVVFDDARPANAVRVETSPPELAAGETCIRGEARGSSEVAFPQLEQYFVTAEQGKQLEQDLRDTLGVIRTTGSCRAVLVKLEPR